MSGKREVKVVLSGDADALQRSLKVAGGSVQKFGDEAEHGNHKIAGLLGTLAGGAAGAAVVGFLKGGLADIHAAAEASAQTQAVLKSTSGAAGVTQDHIEGLADSLEKMSGVAAENVQAGQNMLLTFTNIQGTNFDAATKTMLDMSVAMGTDAKGQAIALGKALNDPIKGVGALSRVGVTFTDSQKAMIKKMQEAGDMAGAQKIILGELNKEFGGSAKAAGETMAGKLEILKAKFGDVRQALVEKLLPALTGLMDFVTTDALPAIQQLGQFLSDNSEVIVPLAVAIGGLAATVWTIHKAQEAWTAATKAWSIVTTAAAAAQTAFNTAMEANPIGLIVVALVALAAGLVYAYKHSETFRRIVHAALDAVGKAFGKLGDAFGWVWDKLSAGFGWLQDKWKLVQSILTSPISTAVTFITTKFDAVIGFFKKLPERISSATSGMWDGIKDAFKSAVNWLIDKWNGLEFKLPSVNTHIPGVGTVGGFTIGTPNIPRLAEGGIVRARPGGSLIIAGEAGEDEVVAPLRNLFGGGRPPGPPTNAAMVYMMKPPPDRKGRGAGDVDERQGEKYVPVVVTLDGRVLHQSLVQLKRETGSDLGLG